MSFTHGTLRDSSEKPPPPPDVLDYFDYRKFIMDRIDYIVCKNPALSQRGLAIKAGFKSPHLLGMILSGQRRLNEEHLNKLGLALKFSSSEINYLKILIQIESAKTEPQRKQLYQQIQTEFFSGFFREIHSSGSRVIRSWIHLAMRECVTLKDFSPQPNWMAKKLGITTTQAKEILEELVELQFLTLEDGKYKKTDPSIHNFGKLSPSLVASYNSQILHLANRSLSRSKEKKYMETLNIALPTRLIPVLKNHIKKFCREMDVLVESHENREEVWMLAIQLFAVSDVGENS